MTSAELNSVWNLKTRLDREKRRLQDLRVMAESTTAILDDLPRAKPQIYKVEKITLLIVACQEKIDELTEQLMQAKFDLLNNLQSLNLNEMCERVLCYHYVACLKFGAVAKLMNITNDYARKLHTRGLKLLGLCANDMGAEKSRPVAPCPA